VCVSETKSKREMKSVCDSEIERERGVERVCESEREGMERWVCCSLEGKISCE